MNRSMHQFFGRFLMVTVMIVCFSAITAGQASWKYTALGDSIAVAYTVPAGSGYVARYQSYVQDDTGLPITLYGLGQNGSTTVTLLNLLRTDAVFQTALTQSEVVTWNIGTNDLMNARNKYKNRKCGGDDNQDCLRALVSSFNSNWDAIVGEIMIRRSTTNTIIRTMDLYNPWVKIDQTKNTIQDRNETIVKGNDFQVLKFYLDQMNVHVVATSTSFGIPVAQVSLAFNGSNGNEDPIAKGLVGGDGLHPTAAGHQLISDLLRALSYQPLR